MRIFFFFSMSPEITPPQQENQLCLLRLSAWTYLQQDAFHEKHFKVAWLASHVFVVLIITNITPVKKEKKEKGKKVFFCLSYISVSLFLLGGPLSICIYINTFLHIFILFYLIHNTKLFICYKNINLYNNTGLLHLLPPSA